MEYAEVLTKVGDWAGSIGIYSLLVECKYRQWALLMVGKFLERRFNHWEFQQEYRLTFLNRLSQCQHMGVQAL